MSQTRNPEQHINEEPRNDFMDLMIGFGGFFGVLFLIFLVGVVIKLMIG
ncbi:YqzM family protein [Paenibacillus sp. N1-5-1-14]|nr:YqzM family protein [Paenibacillus radicibacter]MCR8645253.1 YqzM family protein [Paenibacillus radicibacter]